MENIYKKLGAIRINTNPNIPFRLKFEVIVAIKKENGNYYCEVYNTVTDVLSTQLFTLEDLAEFTRGAIEDSYLSYHQKLVISTIQALDLILEIFPDDTSNIILSELLFACIENRGFELLKGLNNIPLQEVFHKYSISTPLRIDKCIYELLKKNKVAQAVEVEFSKNNPGYADIPFDWLNEQQYNLKCIGD